MYFLATEITSRRLAMISFSLARSHSASPRRIVRMVSASSGALMPERASSSRSRRRYFATRRRWRARSSGLVSRARASCARRMSRSGRESSRCISSSSSISSLRISKVWPRERISGPILAINRSISRSICWWRSPPARVRFCRLRSLRIAWSYREIRANTSSCLVIRSLARASKAGCSTSPASGRGIRARAPLSSCSRSSSRDSSGWAPRAT